MSEILILFIAVTLIIVGLSISFNNTIISLFTNYVFYKDRLASKLIRILGIIVTFSSLFLVFNMTLYCLYTNIFVVFVMTFFSIRGRSLALRAKLSARDKLLKAYEAEIKAKRERIQSLKINNAKAAAAVNEAEKEKKKLEGMSVDDIRKKMWDDGSMTNKDLIDGLKDK